MQIVIDIPKEEYESIKASVNKSSSDYRILNGTPLPENPTNGDMIKTIFLNMIDSCWERKKYLSDVCGDYTAIEYTEKWWNAPYKRGKE